MPAVDTWDAAQYEKFKRERAAPFFDLVEHVMPHPHMTCVDLGCGTGELTAQLHRHLSAHRTVGIDRSQSMLEKSEDFKASGLEFRLADVSEFEPEFPLDLVISNAALQWVPDHGSLLKKFHNWLKPGGQIAIQMPSNAVHPSQVVAKELEKEFPNLKPNSLDANVRPMEEYAALLMDLGFTDIRIAQRLYIHYLESRDAVVEWVKGTLLTHYEAQMSAVEFEGFLERYREMLVPRLKDQRPYQFTFRRLMVYGIRK